MGLSLGFSGHPPPRAHLAEASGGFAKGMVLTQATLTLPQGDIAGDASVTFGQPPSISGNVTSKRIDLDALLEMKSVNPPAPPAAVAGCRPTRRARSKWTPISMAPGIACTRSPRS